MFQGKYFINTNVCYYLYPFRNFSFKEVSLVSKSGSIQINDRNLISSATALYCSTGGDSNGNNDVINCPKFTNLL